MILAILVIILSVVALIFSGSYPVTFTICFFAGAFMQICHAGVFMCFDDKHRRSFGWAVFLYITAAGLLALGAISIYAIR